jgi:hypothetical protein
LLYFKQRDYDLRWLKFLLFALRASGFALVFFVLIAPLIQHKEREILKPVVAVLVDNSRSMLFGPDSTIIKTELLKNLEATTANAGNAEIQFYRFDGSLAAEAADFSGSATDIGKALHDIKREIPRDRLGAVVLVSDGIFNRGSNPLYEATTGLVPIYTVALGDSTRQRDVGFGEVVAPRFVFRGDEILVQATVTASNFFGEEMQVRLKQGNTVLAANKVKAADANFASIQRFTIKTKEPGTFAYDLEIPVVAGERNTRNNTYRFYVEVIESRKKITIISPAPHPDVAAIREALKKIDAYEVGYKKLDEGTTIDPDAELAIVFLQPNVPARVYQAVISNYSGPLWLVVDAQIDGRIPGMVVRELTIPRMRQAGVVRPVLNQDFGLFKFSKETLEALGKLQNVAAFGGQMQTKQPSELLFATPDGFPLALYGGAENRRLCVFSMNSLWQLRMQNFKNYQNHTAFDEWMQLTAQYLTVESNSNRLRLYYEPRIAAGESLVVRAEVYDAAMRPTTAATVSLNVVSADGSKQEYALPQRDNTYGTDISGLAAGTYKLQASAVLGSENLSAQGELIVFEQTLEALNTRANHALLLQLANASGGKFYTQSQLQNLGEELSTSTNLVPIERIYKSSLPLVDVTWLLFLAAFLFAVEWVLRRYFGRI